MQAVTMRWLFVSTMMCSMNAGTLAATPVPAPHPPATAAALRAALIAQMAERDVPGASYAIFDRNGTLLNDAVGLANAGTKRPVTSDTLFRMGSITKTVTAIAIMQLIEQGRFTLQTPVAQLLPTAPIQNRFAPAEPVRVVHLLTHSAGLDDTHAKAFFAPAEQRGAHLAAALAHPETYAVRWRPGTVQSYSNPGYTLLGAILEAHYGQPWDDIVTARVLRPLGMTATVALNSLAVARDHADGHTGSAMRQTPLPFEPTQAAGVLWTNARELALLGRFVLSDGASAPGLLRPETLQLMKPPQSFDGARAGLAHGNGLGIRHRALANERWQGHSGGVMGALASMHFHARQGMGYALLVNSDNTLRKLELPLADYIAAQTQWKPDPAVTQKASADAEGWYRSMNPRVSLLALPTFLLSSGYVKAEGDTLRMRPPLPGFGTDATLRHRGGGLLADIDDGVVVTGAVLRSADGAVAALELDGTTMVKTSMLAVMLPLASVLLAVPLLLSVPFGRRRALRNPWARRLPALALLVLLVGVVCAANLTLPLLSELNWQTGGIAVATTLFPALAILALVVNVRGWRAESARVAKWRCLMSSLAAVVIAAWLASFGLLAFALWRW